MKLRWSIRGKLLLSYLAILLVFVIVSSVTFQAVARFYLVKETRQELEKQARMIANVLQRQPLRLRDTGESAVNRIQLRLLGGILETHVAVFNEQGQLVYANDAMDRLKDLRELDTHPDLVMVRRNLFNERQQLIGTLVLYTELESIDRMRRLVFFTQLISVSAAGLLTLLLAVWMGRHLTGPLIRLSDYFHRFSVRNEEPPPRIRTGDEIEELAEGFETMRIRLKNKDEQQKRFFQNASHELKTPLMSIQGNVELIRDGIVRGEEMHQSLDVILEECDRLKQLVEEVTYLSKLENMEETYLFAFVEVRIAVDQAVQSVRPLAEKAGIKVEVETTGDAELKLDMEKFHRALTNVLANGIRYAKSKLVIQGRPLGEKGMYELMISDDGPGFPNGEEERIFERFYKGEKGGTGIGLAITKTIVEAHGGSIRAEPHPFGGACFRITLPLNP